MTTRVSAGDAAGEPERVLERGERHDGGAVLVVVEDGDVEQLLEPALDLEAARCGDVLQVDAAEARRQPDDGLDDLLDVGGGQADRDGVDAAELLEQHGLALHHRHRRGRADVAEAQDGGAVGDDGDGVGHPRVVARHARVGGDRLADAGDAGRVGEGEVVAAAEPDGRADLHLAADVQVEDGVAGEGVLGPSLLGELMGSGSQVRRRAVRRAGSGAGGGVATPAPRRRPARPAGAPARGAASRRPEAGSSLTTHHAGSPVRVVRRSAARLTARVPSAKRASTSRPGRTGAPYLTSSRSPGTRVGRIESPRTRASPTRPGVVVTATVSSVAGR